MIAYKYCPWNRYTKSLIYDRIMHFSNPLTFNDRYDCQPCGAYEGVSPEEYSWDINEEADKRRRLLNKIEQKRKEMNEEIAKYGVACFSKSYNIPKMWAHYADKNWGVCLKFDLDLLGFRGKYKEILYLDSRQVFDFAKEEIDEDAWFFAKSKDWQEEQEIRYLLYPPKAGNRRRIQRNFRYPKEALQEIIFGSEWTFERWHEEMHTCIEKGVQVDLAFMEQMLNISKFEYKKADIKYIQSPPSF